MKLNLNSRIDMTSSFDLPQKEADIFEEFMLTPICDDKYDVMFEKVSKILYKYLPKLISNGYIDWSRMSISGDSYYVE